jgi:hypothetical protein
MDYSKMTLGELLSSPDKIVRRNAVSILKQYQKTHGAIVKGKCDCYQYHAQGTHDIDCESRK